MDRLPSLEERQWLTHALKKVIARRGAGLLDSAPLVEPTNDWFPEKWASTAAHGHRLAQRLMHYAGLDAVNISLSAYEPVQAAGEDIPWDAGTAGWFAGIRDGRAFFGLHVRQFSDPEAAAGVLAHEVAHAWRGHHRLVVDEREKEERLTDVTTIALGFGILTTNNTDRYRSSGTWSTTSWSISSAGYLSPQAMSWLLAMWCAAREIPGERQAIERHLEPNQRSYFRASLEEIARSEWNARDRLQATGSKSKPTLPPLPAEFTPREPTPGEIAEPRRSAPDPQWNRGAPVYQKSRSDVTIMASMAALGAFFVAWIAAMSFDDSDMTRPIVAGFVCAAVAAFLAGRRARRPACSACNTHLNDNPAVCPGCGGTVGARVSTRELRRIRVEELERRAAADVWYEDCDACQPEHPCEEHAPTFAFGPGADKEEGEQGAWRTDPGETAAASDKPVTGRFLVRVAAVIAIAAAITFGLAWWRQNHVAVYFDNSLGYPVTLNVDGTAFGVASRPPVKRTMQPGRHRIFVMNANREMERAEVIIDAQPLLSALRAPRFYVYSVAGHGTYWRTRMVYSASRSDRGTTSTLLTNERWIPQEDVDYLFTSPPSELPGTRPATRSSFEIADLSPRQIAYALDREGRHDEAIRALRSRLESDPCDTATRQDLIEILSALERMDDARAAVSAWVSACDSSVEAHRTFQDLLGRAGPRETLLRNYGERLRKEPSAVNHYLYGRLLTGPPAIHEFREALRIDGDVPWARIALGRQLLEAEDDLAAYDVLDQALRAKTVEGDAATYFAMAAVAVQKQSEALARLPEATGVDAESLWRAKWILARSKEDWSTARILLAEREIDEPTEETIVLRARLERDAGGTVDSLAEDLERRGIRSAAEVLRFEEAWETGKLRDAAMMNPAALSGSGLPTGNRVPTLNDVYIVEAALLSHSPDAASKATALRARLSSEPGLLALVDAAEGRIAKDALMARIANRALELAPHAWFALGVHASISGGDASALFQKSADRALDREFPYRIALRMASPHGATHPESSR